MQDSATFKRLFLKNRNFLWMAVLLALLSFVVENYWAGNASISTVRSTLENYIHLQENDAAGILDDTSLMRQLSNGRYDEPTLKELIQKPYFVFQYRINEYGQYKLNFWNTQTVLPGSEIVYTPGSSGFIKLDNGYYVWKRQRADKAVAIVLIPVKWNYFITNPYLVNSFATGKDIERKYDISDIPTETVVKSITGDNLFYLTEKTGNVIPKNNAVTVLLRIFAALLLFLYIHLIATKIAGTYGLFKGLYFLASLVVLLRILSYYLPVPLNFRQFELFDPAIYGSSFILRSLGDLLINAVMFTWIVLFIHGQLQGKKLKIPADKQWLRWLVLAIACVLFPVVSFIAGRVILGMVADSQISFDVINFFTLDSYSAIGFLVLCLICITFFLFSQILRYLLQPLFPQQYFGFYLGTALAGLVYLTFQLNNPGAGFNLWVLFWLIIFLLLLNRDTFTLTFNKGSSARFIFWIFFFSVTITIVIVFENNKKELRNREHYAETLATKADPASETLLNTLLTDFRNDYLATNFHRFFIDSTNQFFKDSLVNGNFSGYTNKYETKVFTFDINEKPLYNREPTSFNELNTVLRTQARPTNIPELFYFDESYDRFSYISRKTVTNFDGETLGYVFLLAYPRKYKSDALNLELFSKGSENAIENSKVYAFAVYNNLQLISSYNDYPFATRLTREQVPNAEFKTVMKNNYDELWYKAGPQKVIIITKKNNLFIESITLFSYLFCAFLLIAGLFWLLRMAVRTRFRTDKMGKFWQFSIRTQIHGTIIFISVLSFLVIGVATILFFVNRYEDNNRERLSKVIQVMENEVRASLSEIDPNSDNVKLHDDSFRQELERVIEKISEIHAVDVNLYDLDGNLQVSSLPLPYTKGVISKKMDPIAYYHLNRKKEVQFFKDEKIGRLNFVSNYVPVIDEKGMEYAYLNIPYFTSETKLQEEIANFLVTIINLNAFIFLIAGIVALFITNRITSSFSFISEKMKAINLGKLNEVIHWKRNDEIGELVKEYNTMVAKLDQSAAALAKSEREGAWREMARQVAHEIKNPLTPMKLSLQYLQKSIENKADNVEELTENVARTLVEQIEHLNHIAGEFSQFANIGNQKNEIIDLNEVIKLVTQLHAIDDRINIHWEPEKMKVLVNADRTHLNRLFTNLILNAMQAVPAEDDVEISITEELYDDRVLIKIKDNGHGIAEELRSKIFTPNFTTKTSGTGLGLAMSKSIVEQAKGKIWFETESGVGTTFFIELPVHA